MPVAAFAGQGFESAVGVSGAVELSSEQPKRPIEPRRMTRIAMYFIIVLSF
jgi:hypothetical protein